MKKKGKSGIILDFRGFGLKRGNMKVHMRISAAAVALSAVILCSVQAGTENSDTVNIAIDTSSERKPISPYIYGVNFELIETDVSCTAVLKMKGKKQAVDLSV